MATETGATHQVTEPGSMRIGLFISHYVDMLCPEVGIAALELLERLGAPLLPKLAGEMSALAENSALYQW